MELQKTTINREPGKVIFHAKLMTNRDVPKFCYDYCGKRTMPSCDRVDENTKYS